MRGEGGRQTRKKMSNKKFKKQSTVLFFFSTYRLFATMVEEQNVFKPSKRDKSKKVYRLIEQIYYLKG